jgi:hypothetical protein
MGSEPVRHPSDHVLIDFDLGKLGGSKAAAVNKHLKDCQPCRRRLAKLSAGHTVPDSSIPGSAKSDPAPAIGVEALATAVQAHSTEKPTILRKKSRRWPKLVWPSAAVGALLLGLIIAWSAGAFNATSNASVTTVENQPVPAEPSPTTLAEQRPPAEQQPTTPSPAQVAGRGGRGDFTSQISGVTEPDKVEKPLGEAPPRSVITRVDPQQTHPSTQTPAGNAQESAEAFFNGKDLGDWQGAAEIWHFEKGMIIGSLPAGQKGSALLCSKQKYKDFDLRFRAAVEEGIGDSGVQFRSRLVDVAKFRAVGPECAIYGKDAPKVHRTGSLMGERGKVERTAPAKLARFVKPTENHFRIRCQGKHVLIEVNGIKVVNGDFSSLPDEGLIAWKIDGERPPRKVIFKNIKFKDLSRSSPDENRSDQPLLRDAELLRAEFKFRDAMNKANDNLLRHFDSEIANLQKSARAPHKEFLPVVEGEKEAFKAKGLVPWSQPMRKWLKMYAKELNVARDAIGKAFDIAIDRAKKNSNDKLKTDLIEEAGKVLAPREVGAWEFTNAEGETRRVVFYSDGTFVVANHEDEPISRFWALAGDDRLVREFPDTNQPTGIGQQEFQLSPDGKTSTALTANGEELVWRRVDD